MNKIKYKGKLLNLDLYPTKWEEFKNMYDHETALYEYYKFNRSISLEKYILKYGETQGLKLYNEKITARNKKQGNSLEKCINRHGEKIGTEMYYKWKGEVTNTKENFVRRYGKKLGEERYLIFCQKNVETIKNMVKPDSSYNTKIEFYMSRGWSEEEAKGKLTSRQNTSSLAALIRKYGEEEGSKKYQEYGKKKANTLESFIRRHGKEEGSRLYEKWMAFCRYNGTLQFFVDKYGEIEGFVEYKKANKKKANTLDNFIKRYGDDIGNMKWQKYVDSRFNQTTRYSVVEIKFIENLLQFLKIKGIEFKNKFYKDSQYVFHIGREDVNVIMPDLYIKDINMVIEFYGDYWHRNPKKYNDEESQKVNARDSKRKRLLENKYGVNFLEIWESDYKHDEDKIFTEIYEKIKKEI